MAAKTEKQRRADRAASRRRRRKQNFITFLVLLAVVAVLILVLAHNCKKNDDPQKTTPTTVATINATLPSKTTVAATATQTVSKGETTTASDELTANGYTIVYEDGMTYIDGILVVNKTYNLPSDYAPNGLTDECNEAFEAMAAAAYEEDVILWIASGYRSYAFQAELYDGYVAQDGQDAADRYSARPGSSEHQTGLAIDLNDVSDTFGETPEGQWVAEHCAEYGFIIRYPEGKEEQTGYMYEPWHVRYVGTETAQEITDSGLCLEEYFGIMSEYAE